MANITLYTTKYGAELLGKKGWLDTIQYFSLGDSGRNYAVTADQTIIPQMAGLDALTPKTAAYCATANYQGMMTNPTTQEIQDLIQNGIVFFNKEDCADEFKEPNLTVDFHVMRWINLLKSAISNGYSFDMSEKVTMDVFDYVSLTVREKNFTNGTFDDISNTTDFKISYNLSSTQDINRYRSINPLFIMVNNSGVKQLYEGFGSTRYWSPLRLGFTSSLIGGKQIDGTNFRVSIQPDYWGYNTSQGFVTDFATIESNPDFYDWFYPAMSIGGRIYDLRSNILYNTKSNDQIGYFMNFFNSDGQSALEGLTNRLYLYFKSEGQLIDGKYQLPLNFDVMLTNRTINNLNNIYGNKLMINFILDPTDLSSGQIIELI